MDKIKFLEEIKDNNLEELELIYETQRELYSEEEMKIIKEKIEEFKVKEQKETQQKIKKLLPKEIECPKCFGPNSFENEECVFCGHTIDKTKYYTLDYYEKQVEDSNCNDEEKESYAFQYIISFLIPLIGFILGAILMTKDEKEKINVGKRCVIIGIATIMLVFLIWAIILSC